MSTDMVRRDQFPGFTPFRNSPFREVFDQMLNDPFFRTPGFGFASAPTEEGSLALDIYEKDNSLVVEASVPGYKKDEIDVQVHDGVLSIKAQRSEEREEGEQGGKFYRRERAWGAVSRRVALPGIVKDAPVDAELKNGVLTLRIAMPEEQGPKAIAIREGNA